MSGDVRFDRQHPFESFVYAQKLKRTVTNENIRWLSCACPFCPVYLLLFFAIHSLDVRGSFLLSGDVRQYSFFVRSMFGTFRFMCCICISSVSSISFLSWAHSFFFFAFFHEALWRCSPYCNFSKTGLLEKCVRKYNLLNPARALWCPFFVRFLRYAFCTRSDFPGRFRLLSVTHSETFGLLNWNHALHIRYRMFQPFFVRCMYVCSFGFSTGLTFLPPDNKNSYPFHVRRFNPVKSDRG